MREEVDILLYGHNEVPDFHFLERFFLAIPKLFAPTSRIREMPHFAILQCGVRPTISCT